MASGISLETFYNLSWVQLLVLVFEKKKEVNNQVEYNQKSFETWYREEQERIHGSG